MFYQNNFIRARSSFLLYSKFKNKLRAIPASAEERSQFFNLKRNIFAVN